MGQRTGVTKSGGDQNGTVNPTRIDELERQIASLRHTLDSLSPMLQDLKGRHAAGLIGYAAAPPPIDAVAGQSCQPPASQDRAHLVRDYIGRRRMRSDLFPPEYFSDPVWDMMLDLYAAHHEKHEVSVSSLCIASGVPATTALRWINTLTARGTMVRARDQTDGRRIHVHLSADAHGKLDAYFDAIEA